MQTIKNIKQSFVEEKFSGTCEKDYDDPKEYHELLESYKEDLEIADPDGERENLIWEAGYVRGYEVALNDLLTTLSTDEYEKISELIFDIKYYLTN